MNKKYLLLTGIVLALGIGILFMPERNTEKQVDPGKLLQEIDDPSRFLTTDDITDRLVKKDPALVLIDVRPAAQFAVFGIPGAINIPADSLLSGASLETLNQKEMDKVFYSNSDVTSDQAWILCKRLGLQRIYIMQGGINKWFNTIVKAQQPDETEPAAKMDLYRFRIAACQHFFGSHEMASTPSPEKKVIQIIKKTSGAKSGGGC